MSRKKSSRSRSNGLVRARDKITVKTSKDGLIERNAATGEDVRVSKREAELDLRGGSPESGSLFQLDKRPDGAQAKKHKQRRPTEQVRDVENKAGQDVQVKTADVQTKPADAIPDASKRPDIPSDVSQTHNGVQDPPNGVPAETPGREIIRHEQPIQHSVERPASNQHIPLKSQRPQAKPSPVISETPARTEQIAEPQSASRSALKHDDNSALHFRDGETANVPPNSDQRHNKPNRRRETPLNETAEPSRSDTSAQASSINGETASNPPPTAENADTPPLIAESAATPPPLKHGKPERLRFDSKVAETSPASRPKQKPVSPQAARPAADTRPSDAPINEQDRETPETADEPPRQAENSNAPSQLIHDKPGRLHFTPNNEGAPPPIKPRQKPVPNNENQTNQAAQPVTNAKPNDAPVAEQRQGAPASPDEPPRQPDNDQTPPRHDEADTPLHTETDTPVNTDAADSPLHEDRTDAQLKPDKPGKLRFSADEAAPAAPTREQTKQGRKLSKAQNQADRAVTKLEKAKSDLPAKKRLRSERVFNEETGKPKRKLYFESEVKPQGEHIKGALPTRPVKAAGNSALRFGHSKMFQVEHENVSVKAAHRAEMAAEGGVRAALRHHKTAPYRKVAKLERSARKKSVNLTYQQTLAQNPKLKSNILSRALQKRKIKKDYAKAAREAQKAAKKAKKAGSAVAEAGKALVGVIKRHPIASAVIILILLLLFCLMSLIGAFGSMGSGGIAGIAASTYLAEDAEMYAAEEAYAGMEADLQNELDNYETLHPGYDEYVYELDGIWHDPYVLMSILGAMHDGAWTFDDVEGTLSMLFERQYILTETVTSETRYRTETTTHTDPATGETYEESEDVAYDYYICTVTLENFDLSHLPIYIMGEDALSRYALFTATLGNRPDLFPVSAYPNASVYKEFLRYDIPPEYLSDEVFAGMINEANKYLGMPYVWGGYSPKTSFDCSGFVSWVLNNSGWDIGRLGAQGLFNITATIPAADAMPGDLIFFHSTYRADTPVTHVGIYVGDGMMIHCGDPITYTSIETTYWQNHFYAFGRLY